MSLSGLAKRAVLGARRLPLVRARQQQETLTVVMFHRVLSNDDERINGADPEYTMEAEIFARAVAYCANEYTVISLHEVLTQQLPSNALLITFDDGWADHEQTALPILRAANLPAVVFVVANCFEDQPATFWETDLIRAFRLGKLTESQSAELWRAAGRRASPVRSIEDARALVQALADLAPETARAAVMGVERHWDRASREALSYEELRNLAASSVDIGAHGLSHRPLARVADGAAELRAARTKLESILGRTVETMSFPHGSYNAGLTTAARSDYRHVFTSDPIVNSVSRGVPFVLGRIGIEQQAIVDAKGKFDASRLGWLLHRRPVVSLVGDRSERERRYR